MEGYSERLIKLRKDAGLTQTEVADKLGITQNYYSYIERGKRPMKVGMLAQLCELFDVSADYILRGEQ